MRAIVRGSGSETRWIASHSLVIATGVSPSCGSSGSDAGMASLGRLPIAALDVDHLEVQRGAVEGQALAAAVEQHRLAGLQPELLAGIVLGGEGREHVVIVDDAILEDLDEGRALVGMGGGEHLGQILVHVDRPCNESAA